MAYLGRTDFVLQTSRQHFDSLPDIDPNKSLLGVFLTFLVCISFYSEMELQIVLIVKRRLALAGDPKVANLITNALKKILSRLNKSDITECALLFGDDTKAVFNGSVTAQDVTIYGNMITQRHAVAHSEDGQLVDWTTATLTLNDVALGVAAAERLMVAFEAAIQ
jgi:CheY-specific phosphatase CheX